MVRPGFETSQSAALLVIENIAYGVINLEGITKPDTIKEPIMLKIFAEQ